ncbi:hypothetical protein EJB05_35156 [Eragrostis curvula]|uniref:4-hydroxy-7-methoxy-3-oxo-3,4-dihydro-2H-1,4-benzoxazin-2-yl glucosidebeta-D-glucosidase n=1 Tax=Eragrostis curvula TaxID=38414 RepID=A0A5J9U7C0_9POAL|nr:hypothetical protein EJB05_35156 [Eragrostis curvula]
MKDTCEGRCEKGPGFRSEVQRNATMPRCCTAGTSFWLLVVQLLLVGPWQGETTAARAALNFTRRDFPRDFVFGAGTSAYQYEGAVDEDGRSPSIWDTFTHAGRMPDNSTGDLGAHGYRKYKEDVELMSDTGLEAYRFSISWSRLIPRGRGPVNPKGLKYYNNVINELVKRGIEIHVTLYHLDFPQILEDEYHGWLSPRVVEDFTAFVDVCFREFGDRVKHWTTIDEPNIVSAAAYDVGTFPPARCSAPFGLHCTVGNSTVEPYIVAHNFILAHASAAKLYRDKYKDAQKGVVGMNVYTIWSKVFSPSPADKRAAQRSLDFLIGWIINPLVYGDYPEIMKEKAGSRLPSFSKEQSEMVRGSTDFIGVNHYTSTYVSDGWNSSRTGLRDLYADTSVLYRFSRDDPPNNKFIPVPTMPTDPQGLQSLLEYFRDTYMNIPVYVHENGYAQISNESICDHKRVEYLSRYIGSTLAAVRNGTNVKGYFVWSFIDVYELLQGYSMRYGLHHVDFQDPEMPRRPKLSAQWYSKFLRNEVGINMESTIDSLASSHAEE